MTQPVQMYRSNSGALFSTRYESLCDDLKHLFVQSGDLNEASATKLVAWLTDPRETLAQVSDLIEQVYNEHPEAPRAAEHD